MFEGTDSRQFKQRDFYPNLPLIIYTNNYNTKKLYFVVRRLSNVGEAVPQNGGEIVYKSLLTNVIIRLRILHMENEI
jgi:hypothetical protein